MRVVILDESSLVLDIVHDTLRAAGIHAIRAHDAREAAVAAAEVVLADAGGSVAPPPLANLRVWHKERGLGAGLRDALGATFPFAWSSPASRAQFRARFHAAARRRLARAVRLFDGAHAHALR